MIYQGGVQGFPQHERRLLIGRWERADQCYI